MTGKNIKVGIIGGGNMGAAIMSGIYKKYGLIVCEKDKKRAQMLKRKFRVENKDYQTLVVLSKIIIVAVKPQDMDDVLKQIRSGLTKNHLIISIAAGIPTQYIEKAFGHSVRVIRTMPNMPAQIGEGITAVCSGRFAKKDDMRTAVQIFNCVGQTAVVEEKWMDAITAVSGSGPAYVFLFVECLIKAARSLGLDNDLSEKLVLATLTGSVHQLIRLKEDAALLRAKVTSKGGTTQAAMDVFMDKKFDQIFREALTAATERSKELSRR